MFLSYFCLSFCIEFVKVVFLLGKSSPANQFESGQPSYQVLFPRIQKWWSLPLN